MRDRNENKKTKKLTQSFSVLHLFIFSHFIYLCKIIEINNKSTESSVWTLKWIWNETENCMMGLGIQKTYKNRKIKWAFCQRGMTVIKCVDLEEEFWLSAFHQSFKNINRIFVINNAVQCFFIFLFHFYSLYVWHDTIEKLLLFFFHSKPYYVWYNFMRLF